MTTDTDCPYAARPRLVRDAALRAVVLWLALMAAAVALTPWPAPVAIATVAALLARHHFRRTCAAIDEALFTQAVAERLTALDRADASIRRPRSTEPTQ